MTTNATKHTWGTLRLTYTEPKEILRQLDLGDGERLLVVGDGSMGSYEWAIERGLYVDQHSNVGYGVADVALRDGLTAYYGPTTSAAPDLLSERDRLRAENAELVAALESGIASLEQFVKLGRIPENNQGLRDMRAALAKHAA